MPIGYLGALLAHPLFFPAPDISKTAGARGVFISRSLRVLGCARSFPRRESVSVPHSQSLRWRICAEAGTGPGASRAHGGRLVSPPYRLAGSAEHPCAPWRGKGSLTPLAKGLCFRPRFL